MGAPGRKVGRRAALGIECGHVRASRIRASSRRGGARPSRLWRRRDIARCGDRWRWGPRWCVRSRGGWRGGRAWWKCLWRRRRWGRGLRRNCGGLVMGGEPRARAWNGGSRKRGRLRRLRRDNRRRAGGVLLSPGSAQLRRGLRSIGRQSLWRLHDDVRERAGVRERSVRLSFGSAQLRRGLRSFRTAVTVATARRRARRRRCVCSTGAWRAALLDRPRVPVERAPTPRTMVTTVAAAAASARAEPPARMAAVADPS